MLFSKRSKTPKKIINELLEGEKTLTELSEGVEISKQALLKHLSRLEEEDYIQSRSSPEDPLQKSYSLVSTTVMLSIDENGYAVSFSNQGFLDDKYPLLNQVPQPDFRKELRAYLKAAEKNDLDPSFVVYGSVARGEAGKESDIDLSLIRPKWRNPSREQIEDSLSTTTVDQGLPHSPSLNFQTYSNLRSPTNEIQREILNQGILIYRGNPKTKESLWQILKRYKTI